MFPNTPKTYEQFFRALAQNHPDIVATDDNHRFVTIVQSALPFGQWDLSEYQKKKNSLTNTNDPDGHKLVFVLVMMDHDREQDVGDVNGSFILLRQVALNNWQARLDAQDLAFKAGREIMAWVEQYFELNGTQGTLLRSRINDEPVGPVQPNNQYGWIFNFSYRITKRYCVDAEVWGEFLPFTEETEEL
jgi:hypothetical protein